MTPAEPVARPAGPVSDRGPAKTSYLLLSLVVLLLDQLSKGLIEARLSLFGRYEVVPGFLNLVHVRNRGVAFGLLSDHGSAFWGVLLLVILGLGALTLVAVYFWRTPRTERLLLVSLALIMGGAVGNLVDRIGSGAVTDFIDAYYGSYHWHTFNVADSAITVGIGLMLVDFLLAGRRTASENAPTGGERSAGSPVDSPAD